MFAHCVHSCRSASLSQPPIVVSILFPPVCCGDLPLLFQWARRQGSNPVSTRKAITTRTRNIRKELLRKNTPALQTGATGGQMLGLSTRIRGHRKVERLPPAGPYLDGCRLPSLDCPTSRDEVMRRSRVQKRNLHAMHVRESKRQTRPGYHFNALTIFNHSRVLLLPFQSRD